MLTEVIPAAICRFRSREVMAVMIGNPGVWFKHIEVNIGKYTQRNLSPTSTLPYTVSVDQTSLQGSWFLSVCSFSSSKKIIYQP